MKHYRQLFQAFEALLKKQRELHNDLALYPMFRLLGQLAAPPTPECLNDGDFAKTQCERFMPFHDVINDLRGTPQPHKIPLPTFLSGLTALYHSCGHRSLIRFTVLERLFLDVAG